MLFRFSIKHACDVSFVGIAYSSKVLLFFKQFPNDLILPFVQQFA